MNESQLKMRSLGYRLGLWIIALVCILTGLFLGGDLGVDIIVAGAALGLIAVLLQVAYRVGVARRARLPAATTDPPAMDTDFWGLFENLDWTYGHDRDRRVMGTGMRLRLARTDGSTGEIIVDIDRAVFQQSKEAIQNATAKLWPAESVPTRLRDFLLLKLDECLAITGFGDVHVQFAGIDGFRVLYDEWNDEDGYGNGGSAR